MEFKNISVDAYTKYTVKVTYIITKDQTQPKPDKTCDTIEETIAYIRTVREEYRKLKDIYKDIKIRIHKVQTKETEFEVINLFKEAKQ